MTTLGIKMARTEEPGSVCHHSGTSKNDCPHKRGTYCGYCHTNPRPTPCNLAWVACPNLHEMYAVRAVAIHSTWTQYRLDHQEGRQWDLEVPEATKVWDHMRRKSESDTQR